MTLLLTLAGLVLVGTALAGASTVRVLERRGHRCRVVTLTSGCDTCALVPAGLARGGHVRCACGATGPHLEGSALLAWQAGHQGGALPPLPADAGQPAAEKVTSAAPEDAPHAGEEAELEHFVAMLEASGEAERRAIRRAREKPDPITPQLLREAGRFEEADRLEAEQRRQG